MLAKQKIEEITISNLGAAAEAPYLVAEGIALANYQFLKYKTEAAKLEVKLKRISFTRQSITVKEVSQLQIITDAKYKGAYTGERTSELSYRCAAIKRNNPPWARKLALK